MRVYDPRIGRFLSVDPITRQYPQLTPYQYASNNPVVGIDLDGLELYSTNHYYRLDNSSGTPKLVHLRDKTRQIHDGGWLGWKNLFVLPGHEHNYFVENVEAGTQAIFYDYDKMIGHYKMTPEQLRGQEFVMGVYTYLLMESFENYTNAFSAGAETSFLLTRKAKQTPSGQTGKSATEVNNGNSSAATSNAEAQQNLQVGPYKDMRTVNAGTGQSADPLGAIQKNVNAYRQELLKSGYTNEEIDRAIK